MEREHWSYSQLNTLMQCPLLFNFRYLEKREPETTPDYFHFGNALHQAHKAAYMALKKGRNPVEQEMFDAFVAAWEIFGKDPKLRFGKQDWDNQFDMGLVMVQVLFQNIPREKVIAVDKEFTVPLISADGSVLERPLNGVFDLVVESGDGLVVVDLKTSSRKYRQEDVDADLQATAYCYAIRNAFDRIENISFRFDLLTKAKNPVFVSYPTARTRKDFDRMVSLFIQAEQEVSHGIFLPRKSWRCSSCSYREACADWSPGNMEVIVAGGAQKGGEES